MIAGVLAISSSGFVAPLSVRASSSLMASMMDSGATRDPSEQSFDNDMSGWKPPSGGGGGHSLGGEYNPTDTPDFLPEEGSELGAKAAGIAYTDGMMGSRTLPPPVFDQAENTDFPCLPCGWSTRERRVGRVALQFASSLSSSLMSFCSSSCNVSCLAEHDPDRKKSSGPELAGALESNPDIYVPDKLEVQVDTSDFVLPEPEWRLSKMAMSSTHEVSSRSGECPPLHRRRCGGSSHRLAVLQTPPKRQACSAVPVSSATTVLPMVHAHLTRCHSACCMRVGLRVLLLLHDVQGFPHRSRPGVHDLRGLLLWLHGRLAPCVQRLAGHGDDGAAQRHAHPAHRALQPAGPSG